MNRTGMLIRMAFPLICLASWAHAMEPDRPDGLNAEWRMRYGERVADVRRNADQLDILFIGDSITRCWTNQGKDIWTKEFIPLHAVNIGIDGSQTSNILWMLEQRILDGIRPRVAVLMIGVNNILASPLQSPADIARGVSAIIGRLRHQLPDTRILLLGTFPADRAPDTPARLKIQKLNGLLATLGDGRRVTFLDIGKQLLDRDGRLTPDMSHDGLHLTGKGYRAFADAMGPVLRGMTTATSPPPGDPVPGASTQPLKGTGK